MNDGDELQSAQQEVNASENDVIPAFTVLTRINLNCRKLDFFFFLFSFLLLSFFFKITTVVNSACNVGIHSLNDVRYPVCDDLGERNEGPCRGANLTCWREKSM